MAMLLPVIDDAGCRRAMEAARAFQTRSATLHCGFRCKLRPSAPGMWLLVLTHLVVKTQVLTCWHAGALGLYETIQDFWMFD
eukprot:959717-Rhodomonas_salina.1